jgi:starch phosphorylase
MKLALNGALTIGTLDGANVEIRDHVGAGNIFIFGMTADQVVARRSRGLSAYDVVEQSQSLNQALESVRRGSFSPGEPDRYRALVDGLVERDTFMVCADFDGYVQAQIAVDRLWRDPPAWWRTAILNTASVAWFSSDRTIGEYARDIWHAPMEYGPTA